MLLLLAVLKLHVRRICARHALLFISVFVCVSSSSQSVNRTMFFVKRFAKRGRYFQRQSNAYVWCDGNGQCKLLTTHIVHIYLLISIMKIYGRAKRIKMCYSNTHSTHSTHHWYLAWSWMASRDRDFVSENDRTGDQCRTTTPSTNHDKFRCLRSVTTFRPLFSHCHSLINVSRC